MSHVGKGNAAGDVLTWDGVKWVWAPTSGAASVGPFATIDQATVDPQGRLVDFDTTGLADGTVTWVNSVEMFFVFDAASVLAADGITIAAPVVGAGRWLRLIGGSIKWFRQTTWFVGGGGSDDENVGDTALTPIATLDELSRRLLNGTLVATTTVTVNTGGVGNLILDLTIGTGIQLQINGTLTSTVASAIDAVTATNPATNTRGAITDAATVFVDRTRLRLTSGAGAGAIAWVTGLPAANQAYVSQWALVNPTVSIVPTILEPAPGDTFVVDTLATVVSRLEITIHGLGLVVLQNLNISSNFHRIFGNARLFGCFLTNCVFNDVDHQTTFLSCSFFGNLTVQGAGFACRACVFTFGVIFLQNSATIIFNYTACFDNVILFQRYLSASIFTGPGNAQFVDSALRDSAVGLESGSVLSIDDVAVPFWGTDNVFPFALVVRGGSKIVYLTNNFSIAGSTTAECRIGVFNRAYADLPVFNSANDCGIVERPV